MTHICHQVHVKCRQKKRTTNVILNLNPENVLLWIVVSGSLPNAMMPISAPIPCRNKTELRLRRERRKVLRAKRKADIVSDTPATVDPDLTQCAYAECGVWFIPQNARQKYHDLKCKQRHADAIQKAKYKLSHPVKDEDMQRL